MEKQLFIFEPRMDLEDTTKGKDDARFLKKMASFGLKDLFIDP